MAWKKYPERLAAYNYFKAFCGNEFKCKTGAHCSGALKKDKRSGNRNKPAKHRNDDK